MFFENFFEKTHKLYQLDNEQYGFHSNSCANHAVIELVDNTSNAIENNEHTTGIFYFLICLRHLNYWLKDLIYLVKGKQGNKM